MKTQIESKAGNTLTPVRDLWAAYVDLKPSGNYDWTTGYGETWDYYEARRAEGQEAEEWGGDIILNTSGADGFEGPMMSYFYPLANWQHDPEETARKLADLPLCLVHFMEQDEWGLALTGGGMNLAWEICEAFMRLGYLPPLHFADLPDMAGRGTSERDRWVIAGCRRSAQVAKDRAGSVSRRLRQMVSEAAKRGNV